MRLRNVLLSSLILLLSCQTAEEKYDLETSQEEVLSREKIDEILSGFKKISFKNLDDDYKNYTDPDRKFLSKFKDFEYYILEGKDVFKFIVGKYRIQSFLSTDEYYTENRDNLEANHKQFWLVDKKMLYMVLDLILELDKQGYDKYGFYVRESHRHPKFNEARNGASQSQHLYGKAADLVIEDINKDGDITDEDKQIVLKILEEIVGNDGGLGLYPGTMTVHVDSRGYAARWDKR